MISQSFLSLSNRWLLRKPAKSRESIGYQRAEHFGILFSYASDAKTQAITEFIERLDDDNKKVISLSIWSKTEFESQKEFGAVGDHELNPLGQWKNDHLIKFCSQKFDYLLCLDDQPGPLVQNILLKSEAQCRIGIHDFQSGMLYEMMIKPADTGDLSYKMMDIYKYLSQLR